MIRFEGAVQTLTETGKSHHRDESQEDVELDFIPQKEPAGSSSAFRISENNAKPKLGPSTELTQELTPAPSNNAILDEEDLSFPDGGREAYLVVFGALLATIITFGLMNTIGGIQAYISQHQLANASESSVGWIFSTYFFFAFGGVILTGPLFDFKGARINMFTGSALIVIGLFCTANCTKVYQFVLAYGVVVGVGSSFLMSASLGAVAHWFNKKRGTALGICSIGGSLGGVLWPLMLKELYPKIGYAWTMRTLAFLSILCLGSGCAFVKHRLVKDPQKIPRTPKQILQDSFVIKDLLTERRFLFLTMSVFLCELSLILVTTYTASYTINAGYSESSGFLVLITTNSAGLLGRYVPNYLADHWGRLNVMVITVGVCSVLILAVWLPFGHDLRVMYAFAGLYGFFSSSSLSLTPVCCGQISKTEDFGKRYGTVYFLVSIGNLISLPIGGAIIGDGSGYKYLIMLAGILEVLATITWILTRYYCVGMKIACKV